VIDTHCHLLPGLDDGPAQLGASVRLARELVRQGVDVAVCTPHWSADFPTTRRETEAARDGLEAELRRVAIPLTLELAAELTDAVAITQPIDEIRARSIAGTWVLVELVESSLASVVNAVVKRLIASGLRPVFAHPERWGVLQRDAGALDDARQQGAMLQIVAPSLTGSWGNRVRKTAWAVLESGRAGLLASDAHRVEREGCELQAARKLVVERLGEGAWGRLVQQTPLHMLGWAQADGERASRL
jgi:protein-tyrosine phosphatase